MDSFQNNAFVVLRLLPSLALGILAALVGYVAINEYLRRKTMIAGLASPPQQIVFGHLPFFAHKGVAEPCRDWSQRYGPVYQIKLGNITAVTVNTASAAKHIFSHQSHATSSRPELYTLHKLVNDASGTPIGQTPYSDSLKRRRRAAAAALNRPMVQTYTNHLDLETRQFVKDLLRYGQNGTICMDPMHAIQRMSLSLVLTLNWGVRMRSQDDALFSEIVHVEEELNYFRGSSASLQDYVPLWRLFPTKSARAIALRNRRDAYILKFDQELRQRVMNGTHSSCIQANVMVDPEAKVSEEEVRSISLSMLSAGFETVGATVTWSLGFFSKHPEIQEKAYHEISKMYSDEQPLCDPQEDMKCEYVAALVKECLRYFCVVRMNLPRSTIKEIEYDGKIIPAGTLMLCNNMACNFDLDLWPDADIFRPERWIEHPDAPLFTYGLGYRMCVGALLANRELYLIFMRVLHSFKIEQHGNFDDNPITGIRDARELVAMPKPYKASFIPRHQDFLENALTGPDYEKSKI
ncbi:3-hydroxyphenylacetate 6-hydroxylase [Diaporthe amygdali]|uniref:3-hydroxyphenylacetate 6-hydroxylase n=1 Tax=Phomopsis amygdali TaxID=1214568 RepID=UPI0022FDB43B|nr:3-hydroxyphenylacetate 6-hydroxylase [Diaporthe amygdali]KAJ0122611.1 3-hydroxyphenylacetate 6-hydroxylase [Diaporthe amygdali]